MKPILLPLIAASLTFPAFADPAASAPGSGPSAGTVLRLTAPTDYQVIQRTNGGTGTIRIAGSIEGQSAVGAMEARLVPAGADAAWKKLETTATGNAFSAAMEAPAGGWYRLEVRVADAGKAGPAVSIDHVGIGEVFVVAGQSNSANHGEEKQVPQSGRVSAFDGARWQPAADPQPGASGGGGSFLPPLGDALVAALNVPVGFVACGIGATSVREWLPRGTTFPNPPTIESRVQKRPDGTWECKGEAYDRFVARMKAASAGGFRAVLWHQGESDANQKDSTRTLSGPLYRQYLEQLIRESRRAIGRDVPWFVALVSYHVPGDEASPEIRTAQQSLWKDGIALPGPDSDALKGDLRENRGRGVHFSARGLREHAAKWAECILPWLRQQMAEK